LKTRNIIAVLSVIIFFISSCELSRASDDIILVSTEKECHIGRSLAEKVEEKYDAPDDPLVQKRFEDLGKRLSRICDRQDIVYHFKVLKAEEGEDEENYYNAFCLPGGYVYMFEPLMEVLETDDQIAAVIAHEIGHITGRHAVKRLTASIGMNALMLLAALVPSRDKSTRADVGSALTQLMMAYSRKDEYEADTLSVKYMKQAGLDSEGVVKSMETLADLRQKGRERKYIHYHTHPYLSERIAKARAEVKGYADFESYINAGKEPSFVY